LAGGSGGTGAPRHRARPAPVSSRAGAGRQQHAAAGSMHHGCTAPAGGRSASTQTQQASSDRRPARTIPVS